MSTRTTYVGVDFTERAQERERVIDRIELPIAIKVKVGQELRVRVDAVTPRKRVTRVRRRRELSDR